MAPATALKCSVCQLPLDPILTGGRHLGCGDQADPFSPTGPPTGGHSGALAATITAAVRAYAASLPRTLQKSIGPSGVGVPCDRRLAYQLFDWPTVNTDSDPWPSLVGTGTHHILERAFPPPRWLTEQRVEVRPGLSGSVDLFDTQTHTVVDHKVVGTTSMRRYRLNGPSRQYRVQVHLYGLGMARAGHQVDHVAIAFYPRGGMLSGLWVWSEPFDPAVAEAALARLDNVLLLVTALDPETTPANWAIVPATPSNCTYCPWFRPGSTDLAVACPGDSISPQQAAS